jgi:hypothetical protein
MSKIKMCPECDVPRRINKEHIWRPNGTIVERKNPDHRMVFIEHETLIETFKGIEEIIGIPIERIIIESQRKSTFDSVDHMMPAAVKAIVRWVGTRLIARDIAGLGKMNGMGDIELVSLRRTKGKADYITLRIREPYSLPHFCGNFAGAMEAVDRREVGVSYKEIAPDEFEVTARISSHPLELKERLQRRVYRYKEGHIGLEECPVCKGPMILSQYIWHLDRGVIEGKTSGRRMVLMGPATQEAIIDELEIELGDSIPQAVVEAQRRFARTGFYSLEGTGSEEDFRLHLAKRGLGNLREIEWDESRLSVRLENPCLHLVLAGFIQGLFELASGSEAEMKWELAEDGDLVVEVTPRPV